MGKVGPEWKDLERDAAEATGGKRIIRRDWYDSAPDFTVPDFGMVGECKFRGRPFGHHKLLETARAKYREEGEVILVTRDAESNRLYVTVPMDCFAGLLGKLRKARRLWRAREAG